MALWSHILIYRVISNSRYICCVSSNNYCVSGVTSHHCYLCRITYFVYHVNSKNFRSSENHGTLAKPVFDLPSFVAVHPVSHFNKPSNISKVTTILTLQTPTQQNVQTHSNSSSPNCLSVFDHFVGLSIKELMRVCTIGRINYIKYLQVLGLYNPKTPLAE